MVNSFVTLRPLITVQYDVMSNDISAWNKLFKSLVRCVVFDIMINHEAKLCGAKTIKNAWGFISSVLNENGITPPKVTLPQIIKEEQLWLDAEQIKVFLNAIKGKPCEIGALLGLHGLRRSEILAVTPSKIKDGYIHVEGSVVRGTDGMVAKDTNKNATSRRAVPIFIPRLLELVQQSDCPPSVPYVSSGMTLYDQIKTVCERSGLPPIGVHSLRKSFVSLAYSIGWSERECMLYGGWSDFQTMHNIYIKLSDADKGKAISKMTDFYSDS